jgi:hypothetical protein
VTEKNFSKGLRGVTKNAFDERGNLVAFDKQIKNFAYGKLVVRVI